MSPLVLAVYIGFLFMSPASQGHDTEGPSESECRPYIEKALQGVNTPQSEDATTILADEVEEGISGEETKLSAEEHGERISLQDELDVPEQGDDNIVGEESFDEIGVVPEKSDEEVAEEEGEKDQSTEEQTDQPSTEETQTESVEQTTEQQSTEINEEPSEVSEQQESEEQEKEIDESKETILEDTEHERIEELFDQTSKVTVEDTEEETPETATSQEISEQSPQVSKEIEDEGDTNVEQQETSQETQSEEAEKDEAMQGDEPAEEIVEDQQPSEEKLEDEIISEEMQRSGEEGETEGTSQETQQSEDETEESQPVEEEEEEKSDGAPQSEEDVASAGQSTEAQQSEEELDKEGEGEEKSEEIVASNEEEQSGEEQVKESLEAQSAEETVDASQEVKSEEESIKEEASTQTESEETDLNEGPSNEAEEKEDDVAKSEEVEASPTSEGLEESVESVQADEEKTVESEEIQQENVDTKESAEEIEEKLEEEVKSAEESTTEDSKLVSEEQKETVSAEVEKGDDETEQIIEPEKDVQEEVSQEDQEEKKEETQSEPPEEEELIMVQEMPEKLRGRDHMAQILHLDAETEETEQILSKTVENTLKELKKLYDAAIKPLEILYKYRDLSNRHYGDPEIFSKPLILFMGPWSGGKSTIINYLLENEYKTTALRTGADPSPAYFNIVMWGEQPEIVDGTQLAADWTFSGLQKFGQVLLDRLRGLKLNHPLLQKVNIVEIPGILEIRKQVERLFPFNDACQWFIDRADIIFLVYDPSKLDIGPETEAILDQLKGREMQTRIILNKADQVKPEELMRVQGTLIWNISPLMSSTEPPVMYSTSLWSLPYEAGSPTRLLHAQEKTFLTDLRSAIDKRVENKIAGARRFAVRVRNHAKMVDCYLTTYYNHKSFFDNKKHVSDDIIEHPQNYHIYEGLSTLTNISRYDLPDPDVYRDFFRLNPVYEFQQLSATCTYFRGCPINRLDLAIAYDLPELIGKYKKSVEELLKSHNTNK